ncbi:MAG: YncE family protein [candidate division WOR-3 bacterium]
MRGRLFSILFSLPLCLLSQWYETRITVGKNPFETLYLPGYHKLYVTHHHSNYIAVIDAATNQVIDSIPTGYIPSQLVYNPRNDKVYCTDGTTNQGIDRVLVINPRTNEIIKTIPKGRGGGELLYNPISNKIYTVNAGDDYLTIISGERDSVIKVIRLGVFPYPLILNSRNNKVYCGNWLVPTIRVIDGERDSLIKVINVSADPYWLCYNWQRNKIYVTSLRSNLLDVIDGETDSVIAHIPLPTSSQEICYNPINDKIFVVTSPLVSVIDCKKDSVITSIFIGWSVQGIFHNPINNKIYTVWEGNGQDTLVNDSLAIISGETNQIIKFIDLGTQHFSYISFAHNPIENRVYIGHYYLRQGFPPESTISVIRDFGGGIEETMASFIPRENLPTNVVIGIDSILSSLKGKIKIYNIMGKSVRNASGRNLRSGVYFLEFNEGKYKERKKIILLR